MKHADVMRSIIQASKSPLTVSEMFERTMRIMHETGDPDAISRACGFEPDDIVYKGENFTKAIRVLKTDT